VLNLVPARFAAAVLLGLAFTRPVLAQEDPIIKIAPPEKIQVICGLPVRPSVPLRYNDLTVADIDTQMTVGSLLKEAGIKSAIPAYTGPVKGIEAALMDKRPTIVYDVEYVRSLSAKAKNNWTVISVMAHAIGHFATEGYDEDIDPAKQTDRYFARELRADQFSGQLLKKLGASLDDSLAAVNAMDGVQAPYPTLAKRIEAITQGYTDQQGDEPKPKPRSKPARANIGTPAPPSPGLHPTSETAREFVGPPSPSSAQGDAHADYERVPCDHILECTHHTECVHRVPCEHYQRRRQLHPYDLLHEYDLKHPYHTEHPFHLISRRPTAGSARIHEALQQFPGEAAQEPQSRSSPRPRSDRDD
jgi:hypothetical protein